MWLAPQPRASRIKDMVPWKGLIREMGISKAETLLIYDTFCHCDFLFTPKMPFKFNITFPWIEH